MAPFSYESLFTVGRIEGKPPYNWISVILGLVFYHACGIMGKISEKAVNVLLDLFLTFFKIGLFTFGGGYAMIAVVEDACVGEKKWITHEEMMELIVIAESTPGPIAINCATYVGYKEKGVAGAAAATMGMVLPSLIIIYAISMFFNRFLEIPLVANAFKGIKVGVSVIIINAGIKLLKDVPKSGLPRIILICAFAAMMLINIFSLDISTVWLLVAAGAVSMAVYLAKKGGAAE